MDDIVLLHIGVHHLIAGELEELPQHADRHGKAERDKRQEKRRQTEGEAFASVEQIDQTKADRRDQKAVDRMQHGVPAGNDRVKGVDLTEDLRRVDKAVDNALHEGRDVDGELFFNDRRQREQYEREYADENVLEAVHERRAYHSQHDKKRQYAAQRHPTAHTLPKLSLCRRCFSFRFMKHILPFSAIKQSQFTP